MNTNGYNASLFDSAECYICHRETDLVRHEIFQGTNRSNSKKWGCWVTLCPRCHMDIHEHPAKFRWLKVEAQERAMEANGWTEEEFRLVFGKTY